MRLRRILSAFTAPGQVMRGRVSKVSVLAKGTRSVVIHFGIDEPGALDIKPGTLFEGRILEQPDQKDKAGG